jgi:hypothetical protein
MATPNEKVLSQFTSVFPHAGNVEWTDVEQQYKVQFLNEGVKCMLWYDADGNVVRSHRYYLENFSLQ